MTAELPGHPATRGSVQQQPPDAFAPCEAFGGCVFSSRTPPVPSDLMAPWTADDAEMVALALHTAETCDQAPSNPDRVGHWPTVAGWLALEVRRLRALVAEQ